MNMALLQTRHLPKNDDSCGWIADLPPRTSNPAIATEVTTDWAIIGAGFTGMAAARQLSQLCPQDRIVLLEANAAAEGASARNSGFLIDATLNEGYGTANDIEVFKQKYDLNVAAIAEVEKLVQRFGVDCDWDRCGKLYGARHSRYHEKLSGFSSLLGQLELPHDVLTGSALSEKLGTTFYSKAVWTKSSVMLHTGKLARGLLENLPAQVELFENSPVTSWGRVNGVWELRTPSGSVRAKNLIFATNAFSPELKVNPDRTFALGLTASMSRPLTDAEFHRIGSPAPYGLLSVDLMGATVRITSDRRILIRNTCEVVPTVSMGADQVAQRRRHHIQALQQRFPSLSSDIFENTWSGYVNLSANTQHVFKSLGDQVWIAGCYNANGIGLANLFGREIANLATGRHSALITRIQARCHPARLPPQPLLYWGARLRLAKARITGRTEI